MLYAEHLAWLHAAPETIGNDKTERKPRIKTFTQGAPELSLPECENGIDIVSAFHLSGMAMSSGMGATALTWQELQALNQVTCLSDWELKQVHAMSKAYCSMLHRAEKRIPPPYMRELDGDEIAWIAKQQAEAFDRLEKQTADIKPMKKTRR